MQSLLFCNNTPHIAKLLASVSICKFYLGHKMQVKVSLNSFSFYFLNTLLCFISIINFFHYVEIIHFIIVAIKFLRVSKELKLIIPIALDLILGPFLFQDTLNLFERFFCKIIGCSTLRF